MTEFKCKECDREFSSHQSLEDHNNAKHFKSEKKPAAAKSSFNNKYVWIAIGLIAIFLFLWSTPIIDFKPGEYDQFAQCLNDNGAKMFGAYWCPHCSDQKKMFGSSWKYVNYVECSLPNRGGETQVCIDENIESYPTWEVNGERIGGIVALTRLSELTGCELA